MDTVLHTRFVESPVYFRANGETLFGIFSSPIERSTNIAGILMPGQGFPSTHRNRLWVHVARTLAGLGYSTLRFDYHGVGESTGVVERFDLKKPFVEDLEGAVAHLKGEGFKRFVFIGSCIGSRTALVHASTVSGVEGLVLIDAPVHEDAGADLALRFSTTDLVRRGMHARTLRHVFNSKYRRRYISLVKSKLAMSGSRTRVSSVLKPGSSTRPIQSFYTSMAAVLARKTPVLLIYGTEDRYYRQFDRAARLQLGSVLSKAGDLVQVVALDGEVHGFTRIDVQSQVIDIIGSWFRARFGDQLGAAIEEST